MGYTLEKQFEITRQPRQQFNNAINNNIGRQASNNAINNPGKAEGGLESLLGGIGSTVSNIGKSLYSLVGNPIADTMDWINGTKSTSYSVDNMKEMLDVNRKAGASQDVLDSIQSGIDNAKNNGKVYGYIDQNTGKWVNANEGKESDAFKRWLWGEKSNGDINYANAAGSNLDAAATLADFIPGTNGVIGNTIKGAASGLGNAYAQSEGNWDEALKGAATGAVSGAVTGKVNDKINTSAAMGNKLLNNKLVNNGFTRGAISGAVGGATGGAVNTALNGGSLNDVANSALSGAGQGALQGATAGTAMAIGSKLGNKAMNSFGNSTIGQKIGNSNLVTDVNDFASGRVDSLTSRDGLYNNLVNYTDDVRLANEVENKLTKQANKQAKKEANNLLKTQSLDTTTEASGYGDSELANGTNKKTKLVKKLGDTMQAAQAGITRKESRDIGVENVGQAIDKTYQRTGLSDLQKQAEFGKELTGGENSLLDNIQRNALSATEDGATRYVDTSEVIAGVDKIINETIPQSALSGAKREQLIDNIKADLSNNQIDTITKANNIRSTAMEYLAKNQKTPDIGDKETGVALMKIANQVDDLSYKAVPQENVDAMFETAEMEMRSRAKTASQNGKKDIANAYTKLADEIAGTDHTIQNYRSFKKDFVDTNKIYTKTQGGSTAWNNLKSPLTTGGAVLTGLLSSNPVTGVGKALALNTLAPAVGELTTKASAKLGSKLSDIGRGTTTTPITTTTDTTGYSYNSTLSPTAINAIGADQGVYQGTVVPSNLEQTLANQASNADIQGQDMYSTGFGTTGTSQSLSGANNGISGTSYGTTQTINNPLDTISQAMELALQAGDANAFSQLMGLYSDAYKIYGQTEETQSQTKLTATQQRANAAMNSLERISNMTPDTGYTLSGIPIIGDIATFGGNNYEAEAKSLAQQIGYMVSGANIKEEEAENIGKAYVPQPFDSEQTRQQKLQRAAEIIQQYQNGYATE